jgi:hypothetical protein
MAETKISQLTISPSIDGTEYLIVDNTEVTRRTTINSLSTVYSLTNKQEFNELKNEFTELKNGIETLSGNWAGYLKVNNIIEDYNIQPSDAGGIITYTGTQNITLTVTSDINTTGFTTTFSQLSSGTITVVPANNYSGSLISYGDLYTTAGKGAVASVIRTSNDTFLISGLLQ